MANGLYYTHSGTRWLVVLAMLVAFVFMVYSLITNREQDRVTRIIMLTFSSLVGLQWIVGIAYYLVYGGIIENYSRPDWIGHLTAMTIALVAAHLYLPVRRRASTRNYYIVSVVILVVVALLIVWGINFLEGQRWSFAPLYPPPTS